VFKIKSNYSFLDVLRHAGALDEDIWKQMVTTSRNIDVLPAPDAVVDPTAELPAATPVLDFARYSYDVIIADAGGPEGDWNLSVARTADEVLLVTTNELPELDASQRALICLEANGIERDRMRIVVNRYAEDRGLGMECIARALGQDVFEALPVDDQELERSLMDGRPIASGTPVGKSIVRLATRLLELDKPASGKRRPAGGLLGLLSRN
jgi:pilus assembly protein CpaE